MKKEVKEAITRGIGEFCLRIGPFGATMLTLANMAEQNQKIMKSGPIVRTIVVLGIAAASIGVQHVSDLQLDKLHREEFRANWWESLYTASKGPSPKPKEDPI